MQTQRLGSSSTSAQHQRLDEILHHPGRAGASNPVSHGGLADADDSISSQELDQHRMQAAYTDQIDFGG